MLKYTLKNIMRVPFASIVLFLIVTFLFTGFMVTFSVQDRRNRTWKMCA